MTIENILDRWRMRKRLTTKSFVCFASCAVMLGALPVFAAKPASPDRSYSVEPTTSPDVRLNYGDNGPTPAGAFLSTVGLATTNGAAGEDWTFHKLAGGSYELIPSNSDGLCLQAGGGAHASLSLVPYSGARSQRWRLIQHGAGSYAIVSLKSGSPALGVVAPSGANSIALVKATSRAAQSWLLNPTVLDPGARYVPKGYHLAFSDNFDSSALDSSKWSLYLTGKQNLDGNHEAECYEPGGVIVQNGVLDLQAKPASHTDLGLPYSSGAITAKPTFKHGYFESRIWLPKGVGLWPAFWISGVEHWPPEWDIFEVPYATGEIFQYVHTPKDQTARFLGGANGGDNKYTPDEGAPNPFGGYHIYGCWWTAADLTFYVDGVMTEHYSLSKVVDDYHMYIFLNLAVGDKGSWPGPPDASTKWPANMYVDYVRAYQQ